MIKKTLTSISPKKKNKAINQQYKYTEQQMSEGSSQSRKSSWSSNRSFRSIDQFRYSIPGIVRGKGNRFPIRPTINILLIFLTTFQVILLISSRIYLRGELARTFLSVYVDSDNFPDVFDGKQFYVQIIGIRELINHFNYLFKKVNSMDVDGFVDFYYRDAKFVLDVMYKSMSGRKSRQTIYPINQTIGIVQPFNMNNISDIQLFLLKIQKFQIKITNLTMKQNWEGFKESYVHLITYQYINNIKVQINFDFRISNAMENIHIPDESHQKYKNNDDNNWVSLTKCANGGCYYKSSHLKSNSNNLKQFSFTKTYIIKVRVFYILVLIFSIISLFFNFRIIRKTYKILYQQLHYSAKQEAEDENSQSNQVDLQQWQQMRNTVKIWVQVNKLTITQLKLQHYFHVLEFDTIFSTLSNVFEIIAAFYLVFGYEKQRVAGLTCLFSWLTIFKFIRSYKKLSLMYQLIKASIFKVTKFFIQFLPVFISYALLGLCLFPKVRFFASLADSVTTLVSLMMGDSISMITSAIGQKNSQLLSIVYIFTFVLLFMHAIHNTLTALIKQFFLIKKIQLVKWQKQINKQQQYVYIQQLKTHIDIQKSKLPLKLKSDLIFGLMRIKVRNRVKQYEKIVHYLYHQLENIHLSEKWIIYEHQLSKFSTTKEEFRRRAQSVGKVIGLYNEADLFKKKSMMTQISQSTIKQSEKDDTENLQFFQHQP